MQLGNTPWVSVDGDPIVLTLIAKPVWDAIVAGPTSPDGPLESLFEKLSNHDPIAHGIYHEHLPEVAAHLRELAIVFTYLRTHGRTWTPPGDYGQHWRDEIASYLQRARQTHRNEPSCSKV